MKLGWDPRVRRRLAQVATASALRSRRGAGVGGRHRSVVRHPTSGNTTTGFAAWDITLAPDLYLRPTTTPATAGGHQPPGTRVNRCTDAGFNNPASGVPRRRDGGYPRSTTTGPAAFRDSFAAALAFCAKARCCGAVTKPSTPLRSRREQAGGSRGQAELRTLRFSSRARRGSAHPMYPAPTNRFRSSTVRCSGDVMTLSQSITWSNPRQWPIRVNHRPVADVGGEHVDVACARIRVRMPGGVPADRGARTRRTRRADPLPAHGDLRRTRPTAYGPAGELVPVTGRRAQCDAMVSHRDRGLPQKPGVGP
jgi:hypothetical protein